MISGILRGSVLDQVLLSALMACTECTQPIYEEVVGDVEGKAAV